MGPGRNKRAARAWSAADVLVAGVDNDEARYLINHLALQYMLPYFDAGVAITSRSEVDFAGRYFAVLPGITGCIDCKAFTLIERDRVIQSFAHPVTAASRRAAGYVVDEPTMPAPSAYVLNQRTAAILV